MALASEAEGDMVWWRRIGRDIRRRRYIDVYAVAGVSMLVAVLSLVGDAVGDDVRWSVALSALGLLTYQLALPERTASVDDVFHTRAVFDDTTVGSRLMGASEVWVYGPSAVNLLTADAADVLRRGVLSRSQGALRVVVLDPLEGDAVAIARRQLDESLGFPAADLRHALGVTVDRLERMAEWDVEGTFEYRFAPYNPGFSLLAVNPYRKDGEFVVEFHGLRNESTGARMHIELTRRDSEHWFEYWRSQFEYLWDQSRVPASPRRPGLAGPSEELTPPEA